MDAGVLRRAPNSLLALKSYGQKGNEVLAGSEMFDSLWAEKISRETFISSERIKGSSISSCKHQHTSGQRVPSGILLPVAYRVNPFQTSTSDFPEAQESC